MKEEEEEEKASLLTCTEWEKRRRRFWDRQTGNDVKVGDVSEPEKCSDVIGEKRLFRPPPRLKYSCLSPLPTFPPSLPCFFWWWVWLTCFAFFPPFSQARQQPTHFFLTSPGPDWVERYSSNLDALTWPTTTTKNLSKQAAPIHSSTTFFFQRHFLCGFSVVVGRLDLGTREGRGEVRWTADWRTILLSDWYFSEGARREVVVVAP